MFDIDEIDCADIITNGVFTIGTTAQGYDGKKALYTSPIPPKVDGEFR